jgi:hypothetical protein
VTSFQTFQAGRIDAATVTLHRWKQMVPSLNTSLLCVWNIDIVQNTVDKLCIQHLPVQVWSSLP